MKWKDHIKQFPELEKRWNNVPEATKTLFEIQIDAFANGLRANAPSAGSGAWIPIDGKSIEPADQQLIEVMYEPDKIFKGKRDGKWFVKPNNSGGEEGVLLSEFKYWRPIQAEIQTPAAWIAIGSGKEPADEQLIEATKDKTEIQRGRYSDVGGFIGKHVIPTDGNPIPFEVFKFWRPAQRAAKHPNKIAEVNTTTEKSLNATDATELQRINKEWLDAFIEAMDSQEAAVVFLLGLRKNQKPVACITTDISRADLITSLEYYLGVLKKNA